MVDHRVAKRYAKALFAVAKKQGVASAVVNDFEAIVELIHNDPSFKNYLLSPVIAREHKLSIADKLFADKVNALSLTAFRLIIEKRREVEFEAIVEEYADLLRDSEDEVEVNIDSAFDLSEKEQANLIEKAHSLTGRVVVAHFSVDPSLIGGVRLKYDNIVLDGSLRGQLAKLGEHLKQDARIH